MQPKLFLFIFLAIGFLGNAQQPYRVITTTADGTTIPEGIAIDPRNGNTYISSINHHKILVADKKGKTRDFIKADQDGYLGGLGMSIDLARNWIWAVSILKDGEAYFSRVHAFDLKTGRTTQHYELKDTAQHVLNDLTVTKSGIYITDTYFGAIYRVDPDKHKFELFLKNELTNSPNGIVPFGDHLIIATYTSGIINLDLQSKTCSKMGGIKDTIVSHGLDGLALHNNILTGVYNMSDDQSKNLIAQYRLNQNCDSAIAENILDKGNSYFHEPTTIAYYDGHLYAIANSHIGIYNNSKSSTKGIEDKLLPVSLIVYPAP